MTRVIDKDPNTSQAPASGTPLGGKIFAARAAIFAERLWPALLPTLGPFYLFVILSLFGLWDLAGPWAYWLAVLSAVGATLYCFARFWRGVHWPARREAMARLERDGAVNHNPLQALEDAPFDEQEASNPLWRAHLEQMRAHAAGARLVGPHAPIDRRDPLTLRYAAFGLLAVALTAAGREAPNRLVGAFEPKPLFAAAPPQIDVWIDPPAYTQKPPIHLLRSGETIKGVHPQISAPEGSTIIAQTAGAKRTQLSFHLKREKIDAQRDENNSGAGAERLTIKLFESGAARLRFGGQEAVWPIDILMDRPPQARLTEQPEPDERARLKINFQYTDDYAIKSAEFHMRLDPDQNRPKDAPEFSKGALNETASIPIQGALGASGRHQHLLDLQSHPWAGLVVTAKVIVTDGAGAKASTETVRVRLPARTFYAPLAKAVVEQRQHLATGDDPWRRVGRSFDALTLAPEAFYDQPTDYILLRAAYRQVNRRNEAKRNETVNAFWPLALYLEDQDLALARRKLDAAADALREALANGAEEDEINQLVQELRQAMNEYLQAFAQSDAPHQQAPSPGGTEIAQQDLEKMLSDIENLSKTGAQNAAQSALSDLENLLNNLQRPNTAQANGQQGAKGAQASGDGESGDNQSAGAAAAGDLIGRQRDLADRTHREGLAQRHPNRFLNGDGASQNGEGANNRVDTLAADQKALSQDLNTLGESIARTADGSSNLEQTEQALTAFAEAAREMQRAEQALQSEYFDAAGAAMARAIAALRNGAEALAESGKPKRQQAQDQSGEGESDNPGLDPLGRPIGRAGSGENTNVPDQIDAARARAIINQLRERLSDGERSQEEVKYLERLLERF